MALIVVKMFFRGKIAPAVLSVGSSELRAVGLFNICEKESIRGGCR